MLNLLGSIVGMMVVMVNLVAIVGALRLSPTRSLIAAAGGGAWVGLAISLAAAGLLAFAPDRPVPLVGVLCAAPLLAMGLFWFLSPSFREALIAIPMSLLIGLNTMRIFGALFLALETVGRLSGPFPPIAGWGDIFVGVLAAPLAFRAAQAPGKSIGQITAWNTFGAIDLFVAVGLGITSAEGSPLQVFHVGVGSEAMQFLPFSLVPTVLVPFFMITHFIVAAQIRRKKA